MGSKASTGEECGELCVTGITLLSCKADDFFFLLMISLWDIIVEGASVNVIGQAFNHTLPELASMHSFSMPGLSKYLPGA